MLGIVLKAAKPKRALLQPFSRLSSTSSRVAIPTVPIVTGTQSPVPQSPNYATTWSTNQRPRPAGSSGPRFEQTVMEVQPNPLSAIEMIANEPIRIVNGRKAVCDGGNGALGHPKIFINLDQPGPRSCGYCGLRFEQSPHHSHAH